MFICIHSLYIQRIPTGKYNDPHCLYLPQDCIRLYTFVFDIISQIIQRLLFYFVMNTSHYVCFGVFTVQPESVLDNDSYANSTMPTV